MVDVRIEKKILTFRKQKKMSIQAFSDYCGISTALISQLERGIGNPSLHVLQLIANALGIPLASLFVMEIDNGSLIRRKEDQEVIRKPEDRDVVYRGLTPGPLKSGVELLMLELKPHGFTNPDFSQHIEEEILFVERGEVTLVFEEEEFLLKEEDTVRILPSRKHKLQNNSNSPVRILFIKNKVSY